MIPFYILCASMPNNSCPTLSVNTSVTVGTYRLNHFDLLNSMLFEFTFCFLYFICASVHSNSCPTLLVNISIALGAFWRDDIDSFFLFNFIAFCLCERVQRFMPHAPCQHLHGCGYVLTRFFWFIEFYVNPFHVFVLYLICASLPNNSCPTLSVNTSMAMGAFWRDYFDWVNCILFHFICFDRIYTSGHADIQGSFADVQGTFADM